MQNEFAKCEIKTSAFSGRKPRAGNYCLIKQLGDDRDADGSASLGQMLGDLAEGEVGPQHLLTHGVARSVIAQDGLEILL